MNQNTSGIPALGQPISNEEVALCQELHATPGTLDTVRRCAEEVGSMQRLKQLMDRLCARESAGVPRSPAVGGRRPDVGLDPSSLPPKGSGLR